MSLERGLTRPRPNSPSHKGNGDVAPPEGGKAAMKNENATIPHSSFFIPNEVRQQGRCPSPMPCVNGSIQLLNHLTTEPFAKRTTRVSPLHKRTRRSASLPFVTTLRSEVRSKGVVLVVSKISRAHEMGELHRCALRASQDGRCAKSAAIPRRDCRPRFFHSQSSSKSQPSKAAASPLEGEST